MLRRATESTAFGRVTGFWMLSTRIRRATQAGWQVLRLRPFHQLKLRFGWHSRYLGEHENTDLLPSPDQARSSSVANYRRAFEVCVIFGLCGWVLSGCSSSDAPGTNAPANSAESPSTTTDVNETKSTGTESQTLASPAEVADSDSELPSADEAADGTSVSAPAVDPSMAEAISQWLTQLAAGAEVERVAAVEALADVDRIAYAYILTRLNEGERDERRGAAKFLIGRVGPADISAVDALIQASTDTDDAIRHAAFQALERSPDSQLARAIPQLAKMANNPDEESAYRVRAVRAIGGLGPAGQEATEILMQLGHADADLNVRRAVFAAIPEILPADQAEAFFVEVVRSDAPADLRRLAIARLSRVARSESTLSVLVEQFQDPNKMICRAASDAFVEIGKPAVSILVEQGLASENTQARRYATFSLGKMGQLASDAVPALQQRLEDPNEEVRKLAAAALKLITRRQTIP
jgi:HEAT repeat protein